VEKELTGETLRYRIDDHILMITLNRPERLNALNRVMATELGEVFNQSDADDDVRAVVLTGAGRAFCSGLDLERADIFDVTSGSTSAIRPHAPNSGAARDLGGEITLRLYESLKPIIAAVNGPAVGFGATLLLPIDIRLASKDAVVGYVFARRGIVPDAASSWFLPRVVGISRALDWTLSGNLIPAEEAHAAGLFQSLHDPGELLAAAWKIAEAIVRNVAPVSASLTRQMMWRGLTLAHPMQAHRIESRIIAARGTHADSREGVEAFLEKRSARFAGRVPTDLPDFFPWWPPETYD
jgi:enoyl-CoA hydratase/carnithine racemase